MRNLLLPACIALVLIGPANANLLDFYFNAGARHAVTEAFLLIYRPPLLDILPMYIIFLVFTSVALTLSPAAPSLPFVPGAPGAPFSPLPPAGPCGPAGPAGP